MVATFAQRRARDDAAYSCFISQLAPVAEDTGGVALGVTWRADVVEPGAHLGGGDAKVRPEEGFTEEAVEFHADGVLEEGDASHVAGSVPGIGPLVGVFLELTEVGRQELLVVALDSEVDAVGDEGRGVAEEVNVLVDLLNDLEGELGDEGAVGDKEDRDPFVAAANGAEDLQRSAFIELIVDLEVPVDQDGGVGGVAHDKREPVFGGGSADDFITFFADRVDEALHRAVRDGVSLADLAGDQ